MPLFNFNIYNMKKITLLLACFAIQSIFAQFTVTDGDGNQMTEGQIFTFSSLNYQDASLDFFVNNTTSSPITTKIKCVAISNATGQNFELCYGTCLNSVAVGQFYPQSGVVVQPNSNSGPGNHFFNTFAGDGNSLIDYTFKFVQLNSAGAEVGNGLTIVYRYDPNNLSSDSFRTPLEKMGVKVLNSIVTNNLNLTVTKTTFFELFDVTGRKVFRNKLTPGNSSLSLSNLPSSVYIASFTNATTNKRATVKIIKK